MQPFGQGWAFLPFNKPLAYFRAKMPTPALRAAYCFMRKTSSSCRATNYIQFFSLLQSFFSVYIHHISVILLNKRTFSDIGSSHLWFRNSRMVLEFQNWVQNGSGIQNHSGIPQNMCFSHILHNWINNCNYYFHSYIPNKLFFPKQSTCRRSSDTMQKCDSTLWAVWTMEKHERIHTGEKPF